MIGAWTHAASAAFWMVPINSVLSTTSFCPGLSALVNTCLMQNCLHTSPKSPPKNFPPLSDLAIATFEGTPSAHASAKNFLRTSPESDLCFRKYTYAWRE